MTLSATKLRGVVNLLADPLQASAAAGILAAEARERGVLVADLIAETMSPPSEAVAAPTLRDVAPIDDGGFYARRIDAEHVGVLAEVIHETDKAWKRSRTRTAMESGWRQSRVSITARIRAGERSWLSLGGWPTASA